MAAALMSATFPVLAQNLPAGVYEEKNGIAYKKTATLKPGTTDTYTIDLEAFVTGSVTVENKSIPADIVLVLDVSGSMEETIYEYSYTAQSRESYSYYDIYYYHNGYNENYPVLYYRHTNGNYYPVQSGSYWSGYRDNYYIYYTVGNTTYYLSGTTTTTTRPSGITNYNSTIWTGVLYLQTATPKGTKIDALKDAVDYFIEEIQHNDLYDDDGNRRKDENGKETTLGNQISIVKFAGDKLNETSEPTSGNATYNYDFYEGNTHYSGTSQRTEIVARFLSPVDDYDSLTDIVDNLLYALGGTAADYGTEKAISLFDWLEDEYPDRESARTVVFFTDGSPTHTTGFNSTVASTTIGNAFTLKNTYNVTVFTIGVFSNLGSDANNVNNYMNYVSSNYPDARNMSMSGNAISDDPEKLIYYQNASGADLSAIFKTVAQASGGSGNTEVSGGSVVTVDVVASSFSLPKDVKPEDITVKVALCTGTNSITWTNDDDEEITGDYLTFDEPKDATDYGLPAVTPIVNEAERTVSTTGFDFSANWCGYNEDTQNYQGYKQIISFDIKVNPDAVGGPNVATNDKKSGIYVDGRQVAEFNRPTVKIPISIWIKKQGLLGDDSAVFNIRYAPYQKGVDPTQIPKSDWKSFTKVMISKDSPKDPKDNLPMEKLVGLDPNFFYRIDEDAWAWSYNYQDNGTQYTVGEDLVNPFKFTNEPKETVREAEATVRNEFAKKTSE